MTTTDGFEIRRATTAAEVSLAEPLLDGPVLPESAARFTAESGHHLLLARSGSLVVGMITGVELTHPDKGTEMFLYELEVAEGHRRRGIGRALVASLADLARERRCYGMWVLIDNDNHAALATYRSAGGGADENPVLLAWTFS